MTDPRADFLQTIIASPDDDTPRLVYADWLEEYGAEPERAEFIRVQIELARLPEPELKTIGRIGRGDYADQDGGRCGACLRTGQTCRYHTLRRREKELLMPNRGLWFPLWETLWIPLEQNWRGLEEPAEFRRGFVSAITCTWQDWLTHHAAIMRVTPLREVALTTWPETTNVRGEWYYFNAEPEQRIHVEDLNGAGHDGDSLTQTMLRVRWPGIKFTLPPAITETPAEQLRRQRDDRLQNPRGRIIRDGFTLRLDG